MRPSPLPLLCNSTRVALLFSAFLWEAAGQVSIEPLCLFCFLIFFLFYCCVSVLLKPDPTHTPSLSLCQNQVQLLCSHLLFCLFIDLYAGTRPGHRAPVWTVHPRCPQLSEGCTALSSTSGLRSVLCPS